MSDFPSMNIEVSKSDVSECTNAQDVLVYNTLDVPVCINGNGRGVPVIDSLISDS